jgi:hypothetical protein
MAVASFIPSIFGNIGRHEGEDASVNGIIG